MKTKKSKKIIIIIIVAVVLLFIIGAVVLGSIMSSMSGAAMVTTTQAEHGELQESLSTSGVVKSGEVKVIFSQVNGRVSAVPVAAGDAVHNGDVLVAFDMDAKDQDMRLATLEHSKSDAGYYGAMADNNENQADLREANTNLPVLEKQIADTKAELKELKKELSEEQRDNNNDLAEDSYELNKELGEVEKEIAKLTKLEDGGSVSGNALLTPEEEKRLKKLEERRSEITADISKNNYLQSVANSTDKIAELEEEIEEAQERLADYESYKAKMESQKSGSENAVLDSYDKKQYESDHEVAQISYKDAENEYNIAKQGILADFDGIITECVVVEGSTISEGTQLMTLESSESVKVTFSASKYDVEKLAVGQKVDVEIMNTDYEGEISKINRMTSVNESAKTPMVGVEVTILNPDDKIILGMDAKLEVYTAHVDNALIIPVEAVNADKDGDFLYVVENGVVARRPVVCGISTNEQIEILEGITEADEVILTSFTTLEEGMKVNIMPEM